ncbi:MAG TPA: adenylate/guanylate cyclase domain-containing protein, partial [Acidimicrobiales bacterium]|nr:adenylate/guanylate cyclase domain-containing protein [Acidimicrobiales bacterium]
MGTETATILVVDLVGSTELRAALGEDAAEELRRRFDRLVADVVAEQGGTLIKGLGDGALASFAGAAAAVSAGVSLQQGVDVLARKERQALAVRVGLSAGDVTVEDGDTFGVPVVEASRLCGAAAAGQILAADIVRVLARGRGGHELTPVGALDLKGLPDPVEAVAVGWAPLEASSDLRARSPYVGRERERAVLAERLAAAAEGAGGLVLVAGEP